MPDTRLCVITTRLPRLPRGHLDVARAALGGGARFLQFREKGMTTGELVETAAELRRLTRKYDAALIVNDRVDVALAVEADGVHVGESDLPVAQARRMMGGEVIVGASAATVGSARAAEAAGADYLGVGPVFPTGSKADAGEAIGLVRLAEIAAAVSVPVLAIGGITASNVRDVMRAGVEGVAVIAAVAEAEDMVAATVELLRTVRVEQGSDAA